MRRPITLALLGLAVLAGAYALYWWQAARTLRGALETWAAAENARGGAVQWDTLDIGGFPLTLNARATGPRIRLAEGPEWTGPAVEASAAPWNLTDIALTLPGRHRLLVPDAGPAGRSLEIEGETGAGALDFTLGGDLSGVVLHLASPSAGIEGFPEGRLRAASLSLSARLGIGEKPNAHLSSADIRLPPAAVSPLGPLVERFELAATLTVGLPRRLDAESLASWSRAGGQTLVDTLMLAWGPLQVSAQGDLKLDDRMQPAGRLNAEITGIDRTLDRLSEAGLMRPNDAAMAKAAAGLLGQRATPDSAPVIRAPLVMRDGWLYLGPIRLAPLPRLES